MGQSFANGAPTKEFFVEMLTRDIELNDAILDLLDNCLDGVVRSCPNKSKDQEFYSNYKAEIKITETYFSITDNCGGIPKETAQNYAFRMGRVQQNSDLPTVGIYGIGMKRAIFKMGREAVVHTMHKSEKYSVRIPLNWAENANDWNFPMEDMPQDNHLEVNGTQVVITHLNNSIAELWNTKEHLNVFVEKLKKAIQESYSLIIQKGFKIIINDDVVKAYPVELLVEQDNATGIRPYVYINQFEDVKVKLAIGFYAPPPTEEEIDELNESRRSSSEAGITVVCNDRVVLYNDKSYLTGWGTGGVPQYHTQFIGIKGIVVFESNNPKALPMTTTKRGVDYSSAIYVYVKDRICEGLKLFTNYTNKWKGRNQQERVHSAKAEKISYTSLFSTEQASKMGVKLRNESKGQVYRPNLPTPPNETRFKIIRYTKSIDEIKKLTEFFFGDSDVEVSPSIIGEKSFDFTLDKVKKGEE